MAVQQNKQLYKNMHHKSQSQHQNQQIQNQKQEIKTNQINSEEQILKYNVRQDFLNVIGIAAEFQAGIQCLEQNQETKNEKTNQQLITMLNNRLILQINLSNSIHYDQSQQYKNQSNLKELLNQEKSQVKEFLNTIKKEQKFDQRIIEQLDRYFNNCLTQDPIISTQQLLQIDYKPEFNQESIQKLLSSMSQTDQVYKDLQNGKTVSEQISQEIINKYINQRQDNAKKKLQKTKKNKCSCTIQ